MKLQTLSFNILPVEKLAQNPHLHCLQGECHLLIYEHECYENHVKLVGCSESLRHLLNLGQKWVSECTTTYKSHNVPQCIYLPKTGEKREIRTVNAITALSVCPCASLCRGSFYISIYPPKTWACWRQQTGKRKKFCVLIILSCRSGTADTWSKVMGLSGWTVFLCPAM